MKKMNTEFDKTLIEFVANSLKNKTNHVDEFEKKFKNFYFNGENGKALQLLVIKAFDLEFEHLIPLAKHLTENGYAKVDNLLASFAALQGCQLELELRNLKKVEDLMNRDFDMVNVISGGSVKITNKPIEDYFNFSKKILMMVSDEEVAEIRDGMVSRCDQFKDMNIFKRDVPVSKMKLN